MQFLSLNEAKIHLEQEKIIIYPTETFYALGGLALSQKAADGVFKAKEREGSKPLPIIIGNITQLPLLAINISSEQVRLATEFWPGPLSIIFESGPLVPASVSCNTKKIAIRQTPHAGAASLCLICGPLTASSANFSGKPPAFKLCDLDEELTSTAKVAELAPPPLGGAPSTLVEVAGINKLKILRKGAVAYEDLASKGWEIV